MSHSQNTKTPPKKTKQEIINEKRLQKGFLPQYSDFYFERKSSTASNVSLGILLFSGFFLGLASDYDYKNVWINIISVFSILQFILYLLLPLGQRNTQKLCGFYLEDNGIRKDTFFSLPDAISYETIEKEVLAGNFCYESAGLVIGQKPNKLIFHYEIGDSIAQKHIKACYALLQTHLTVKLPPFETKDLDLLDRRYFYRKNMRKHFFSLLIAFCIFCLIYIFAAPCFETDIFLAIVFILWEGYSLYQFYRSARYAARNHALLKEKFSAYPNVKFGWQYAGYVIFFITAAVLLAANFFVIMNY